MKLKRMVVAVLVVGALAGTAAPRVSAADNTEYSQTWTDAWYYYTTYAIQSVAGWFGKCFQHAGTCIQP